LNNLPPVSKVIYKRIKAIDRGVELLELLNTIRSGTDRIAIRDLHTLRTSEVAQDLGLVASGDGLLDESALEQSTLSIAYSADYLPMYHFVLPHLAHIRLLKQGEGRSRVLEGGRVVEVAFAEWVAQGEIDKADPGRIQRVLDRLETGLDIHVFLKTLSIPAATDDPTVSIVDESVLRTLSGIDGFISRQPPQRLSDDQKKILQEVLLGLQA